ncbi:hypothetical protein BaRGS_00009574 [Batillaria attramentaria]|uniref:Major facilitator superfamily (MFS) profile domain-containing protein n=1 Tax=Batillaria attramentaria TaxID=370345 RepID=A0ABD0LK41_9CAEN
MESRLPEVVVTTPDSETKGEEKVSDMKPEPEVTTRLTDGDSENGMLQFPEEEEESPVPDGGWGWVVCAGSFMVNFIIDGTMFSFGILLLDLLDDFGEGKAITSWVGSAQLGMSMMMGPMVSLLLKKFSVRQVAIAGTLVSTSGFIASVFAPNVYVLIVMYGIVGGTGLCMTFMPSIIVVGLYFSKKRAIATGIATSGSGVGTFAYAYICDMLLDYFTWRQTILILTGLLLNCLACGLLFRPLVTAPSRKKFCGSGSSASSSVYSDSEEGETAAMVKSGVENGLHRSALGLSELGKEGKGPLSAHLAPFSMPSPQLRHSRHRHHRRHHHRQNDSLLPYDPLVPHAASLAPDERLYRSVENFVRPGSRTIAPASENKVVYFSETQLAPGTHTEEVSQERNHIAMGLLRPILRKDIYYSGSVSHLAEYQVCGRSMTSFLAHMTQSVSDVSSTTTSDISETGFRRWRRKLVNYLHLNLFKNTAFVFLLVVFTLWTVQAVPMTYLPNLAVSKGIKRKDAAFLISIVGITNTAARIVAGIVTDTLRVRSIWLYVGALLLGAGVNFIIPWCNSFPLLATAAAAFGVCMAVAVSMRTIVLAEQLGITVLTQSFGVVALFQGLAFTVNPPLAGKLFDVTGAYYWPFMMTGFMYVISGVASLIVALCFKPLCLPHPSRSFIVSVEEVETESSTVSPSSSSAKSDAPSSDSML